MAAAITRKKLSSFRIIILAFAGIILLGSILLSLPFSTRSGSPSSFADALFTAVSATCVTGLVVQDTATHWSFFGQSVILLMIQIGGLGVVMASASFALLSGRKISLKERSMMQEAFAAPRMEGIVRMATFILRVTFATELIGALIMMPTLCGEYGFNGIWMSLFVSISAFCNAGFDIMGRLGYLFPSLSAYATNPLICFTISALIVFGGIGFVTWNDISSNKGRFRRYSVQSKVIIMMTAILIILPALFFFFFEYHSLPPTERVLSSVFQSITTRTAGFNVEDMTKMSEPGQALTIILMLIGGSPGSTAGGIKTTTLAVLLANFIAVSFRKEEAHLFGRRLDDDVIKQAGAIFMMYVGLVLLGAVIICLIEGLPYLSCLFECASAIGTVGLSLGITPQLGIASRIILMMLMFLGRVGGLTVIYAATKDMRRSLSRLPHEHVTVG